MTSGGGEGSDRPVPAKAAAPRRGYRTAKAFTPRPPLPPLAGFCTYYGMPVSWVDGADTIVALGHNDNVRAVIAAFNRHNVVDCEQPPLIAESEYQGAQRHDLVLQTWAVNETGDLQQWRLNWPVDQDAEGAFPITVWVG